MSLAIGTLKIILNIVVFFLALTQAYARPCFFPRDKHAQDYGWTQEHNLAVFAFGDAETRSSRCAGTFISDQGHIITAAHCLRSCIYDTTRTAQEKSSIGAQERVTSKKRLSQTCAVNMNGQQVEIDVLFAPPCSSEVAEQTLIDPDHPQKKECKNQSDLALVKLSRPLRPLKNGKLSSDPRYLEESFRCIPLNLNPQPASGRVFTLGVPEETKRPGNCNSSGKGFYFSDGFILQSNTCHDGKKLRNIHRFASTVGEASIQTDLDVTVGNSGGPLILDGMVAGVAHKEIIRDSKGVIQDERHRCEGSGYFESMDLLPEEFKTELTLEKNKCRLRAAPHTLKAPPLPSREQGSQKTAPSSSGIQ